MNLNDYFDPVSLESPINDHLSDKAIFCRNIYIHTPDAPIAQLESTVAKENFLSIFSWAR